MDSVRGVYRRGRERHLHGATVPYTTIGQLPTPRRTRRAQPFSTGRSQARLTIFQNGIFFLVHVIAKAALIEFWTKHPEARVPLQAWFRTMESCDFANFNALRETFASADYVDGATVFNIGGNKFRLIAAIHFNRRKVFIRAVLTHAVYDKGAWKLK
jgi:mRNA interferase HigB